MMRIPLLALTIGVTAAMFGMAVILGGENPAAATAEQKKRVPEAPWSIRYHDGNGNGYRFWKTTRKESARFEYLPVKPEGSSSGIYSGGVPKKGLLAAKRVRELWQRIGKLAADTSLHAASREMGTGAFTLKEPGSDERKFLIKSGPTLKEFDAFLEPFRKGK